MVVVVVVAHPPSLSFPNHPTTQPQTEEEERGREGIERKRDIKGSKGERKEEKEVEKEKEEERRREGEEGRCVCVCGICCAMSCWNYVVTAHKPSHVTHSCVGAFTSPGEANLVVGKGTRVEIHLLTPQGLQVRGEEQETTHASDWKREMWETTGTMQTRRKRGTEEKGKREGGKNASDPSFLPSQAESAGKGGRTRQGG